MRNHITHACVALMFAVFAVACGGRTSQVTADHRDESDARRGVNQRVSLRGCVQPAGEGQGWVLRHVVPTPPSEQPEGQDVVENPIIARGSWVRLEGGQDMTENLKGYVNNEVTVIGDVVSTGANTIGTAGRGGEAAVQGGSAPEQSPARSSVANGDAPRVAVEKVQKIAENCAGE
jgi:hypothetical protein